MDADLYKRIEPESTCRNAGGLDCNLDAGGRTGQRVFDQHDWPRLVEVLRESGCFAKPKDIARQVAAIGDTLGQG